MKHECGGNTIVVCTYKRHDEVIRKRMCVQCRKFIYTRESAMDPKIGATLINERIKIMKAGKRINEK